MRLIDADTLKKHKFTTQIRNGVAIGEIEVVPVAEIDNAPTVEQKYYARVIAQINPVIEARPHGKWIIEHLPKNINNPNDCYICVSCSACGFHYDYMFCNSNYCPNCGAEMIGDKND